MLKYNDLYFNFRKELKSYLVSDNILEKQVRNTIKRSEEQKTPYRKQYRFKIIYEI